MIAITVFAISSMGFIASPAAASEVCTPLDSNYFDGVNRPWSIADPGTTIDGVRARIDHEALDICDGFLGGPSDGDSSVWAMLANGPYQYAQVGYIRPHHLQSGHKIFTEYNDGSCTSGSDPDCDDPNWSYDEYGHLYEVGVAKMYRASFTTSSEPDRIDLIFAGSILRSTPWDPVTEWGTANGWSSAVMGETFDPGDDIAGTPSSPAFIRDFKVRYGEGTSWVDPVIAAGLSSFPYYWFEEGPPPAGSSCSTYCFRIWTDRTADDPTQGS